MITSVPDAGRTIAGLPPQSVILDIGCFGWRLAQASADHGHRLIGLDRTEPPARPAGAEFAQMQGCSLDLPDDIGHLTVASHVLEHMDHPLALFAELARVTAPGGLIWIEAPSEISALPRASDDPSDQAFVSFWDDPTHVRPWTPGALYRLALSCQCMPMSCGRAQTGGIPVSRMLARKPFETRGRPPTTYVSLLGVEPGLEAAWRATWPAQLEALQLIAEAK
jgi:SAM-dependent methyltransferase